MNRDYKGGLDVIESDLPIHGIHFYRDSKQLLSDISPLISEGYERKEKCIFIGNRQDCEFLDKKFKNHITTISKDIGAADFVSWLKNAYDTLEKGYRGLRVFLESTEEHIKWENALDDFSTQPDLKLLVLCQYGIDDIAAAQVFEMLKVHPYIFTEGIVKPNCFYVRVKQRFWLDPLTGIFNRRYFENLLTKELQRAARYELIFSILLVDIDQFKKINDEFKHKFGDHVLKELARILEECIRNVDTVARYGGDDFIILLPETKKVNAQKTAERVLKFVKDHDFFQDRLKIKELSISIGIAGFPEDAGGTYELIKKADKALCQAKQEGGGRAVLCE